MIKLNGLIKGTEYTPESEAEMKKTIENLKRNLINIRSDMSMVTHNCSDHLEQHPDGCFCNVCLSDVNTSKA